MGYITRNRIVKPLRGNVSYTSATRSASKKGTGSPVVLPHFGVQQGGHIGLASTIDAYVGYVGNSELGQNYETYSKRKRHRLIFSPENALGIQYKPVEPRLGKYVGGTKRQDLHLDKH